MLSDGTRVDCLTEEYAIEFDFADKWAEAIGQSLHYALMTGKKPGIVIIIEKESDKKHLKKVKELDAELKRQQATKTNANEAIVSFEEFHELFQNIANYIQKIDSMKDLDYIMRKLFMNFYIQDKLPYHL